MLWWSSVSGRTSLLSCPWSSSGPSPHYQGMVVRTRPPGSVSSELSASAAFPRPPDFMLFPWSLSIQWLLH